MPYSLAKDHPGCSTEKPWGVINQQTKRLEGCSTTRAMAVKHMAALYANEPTARTAAVAPLAPPAEWFDMPEPSEPTPITIQADGRVFGHLALWESCHVGLLNGARSECVKPPPSRNGFSAFHLGSLITAEGSPVTVGKMVVGGEHAPLTASLEAATAHYDKTGNVGAFVRASNGRHGIFLAGAVRSDLSPEGLRDLRANPPSGDWRMLNGTLELIASLAVPIPGFPVHRTLAASADGQIEALIMVEDFDEDDPELAVRGPAYVRRRRMIRRELEPDTVTAAALGKWNPK